MLNNKYFRGLLIILFFYSIQCTAAAAYTVELSKQQVQDAVERYFPMEHATPFAMLTLYRPVVSLEQKSNRIGLAFSILAHVPPASWKGRGRAR